LGLFYWALESPDLTMRFSHMGGQTAQLAAAATPAVPCSIIET